MSINNLLFTSSDGTTLYDLGGPTPTLLAGGSSTPPFLRDPLLGNNVSAVVVGSMTYLTMADSTDATSAIWGYDGTTVTQITGSSNYVDTTPDGNHLAASAPMAAYNSDLIFSQANLTTGADSGAYDRATLAVYDPTTKLITQPSSPNGGYDPHDFVTLSGTLFFEALDSTTQSQAIYSFNGTTVTEVYNLHPTTTFDVGGGPTTIAAAGALAGSLAVFNGSVYFGSGQQTIYQLTSTTSLSNAATNRSGGPTNGSQYNYGSQRVDPIVSGSYLYYLANNSGVWSLNTGNVVHSLVGSIGAQDFVPVDNSGTLYFKSENWSPYSTTVPETGTGTDDLFSSTGTSVTDQATNFSGSDLVTTSGAIYYNNGGTTGLGKITSPSTLSTVSVPNAAGGVPLVAIPFAATSWSLPAPLHPPSLTATGDTITFVQGGTAGVDLFSNAVAHTNDTGQTITGFTMTVSNVTDTTETIKDTGASIALSNGAVGQGTWSGGTVTASANTDTVTITGLSLSESAFDTLIDGLQYINSAGTVTAGARVITITGVTDSGSSNNVYNPSGLFATVNVSATLPAPTVTGVLATDTGSSASDHITNTATLTGTGDASAVVTLTEGTTVLGSTTATGTGAWTFTPTLADGAHTIVASETNATGTGTSTLTFTLDTTAPAVTETLAHDTGSSNSDNITSNPALSGTGDANTVVTLTEGTTVIGSTTANGSGAWTFTPTLTDGAHTIVAHETDTAGNTGTATLTFTLDTVAPAVTETLTIDTGSSASDHITKNPALSGAGAANAVVTLTEGTTVIGSTTASGTGTWTFTPTLSDGVHTIVASETNTAGNIGTSTLTFTLNTVAPLVTETLVQDTGSSASDHITSNAALSGTGDANAVVTLTEGTTVIGSTTANGSGAWTFTPTLTDGAHTIVASETNTAGNTGTATLSFTRLTSVPSINETLVQDTGSSASDHITKNPALSGAGAANVVVTLTEGTTLIGSTTASGSGAWTFTPTLSDGVHTIITSETDLAGNIGTSTLTFTLDTVAPMVTETLTTDTGSSASDHITKNPALSGTGAPNAVVTLTAGTTVIGSTTASGTGTWTFTPTLSDGAHTIVAHETDTAGNTGTSTLIFTLDTTSPAVTEILTTDTGSSNSDNITNNPSLSGTGDANTVVTLTEGTTVIGTTTASPSGAWTFTPTLSDGTHTIVANETDTAGNTGISTLTFTLDTTVPVVTETLTIDTGASSTDYLTNNPSLSGTGDANTTVRLTEGTTVVGITTSDGGGLWSLTPTLSDGVHTIIASETDAAGNMGTTTFTFTLDTTAPVVTETLATDTGGSASDSITSNPALSGNGDANTTVTLTEGTTVIGSTTASGTSAWTFTPTLSDGAHTIVASETDTAGNTGTSTLTFTLDTTAPVVTETLIIDTGSSASDNITSNPALSGTGDANTTVRLTEGTTVIGNTTSDGGGLWSLTPTLSDGVHTIIASETDAAGNMGTTTFTFTLDTTAPVVTETLTTDTGISNSDNITNNPSLSGTGDDNTTVTLTEGTTVIGSTTANGTGAWTFTPTLSDGARTIVASETDTAGNTGTSTLTFTLNTNAPVVTETLITDTGSSASDNITSNPALSGMGDANTTVTLTEGTTVLGTTTADGTGAWTFTPTLADGAHTIVASETDTANNTGSSTLTFTLDTTAPVVTETLTNDNGSSNSDKLTNDPSLSGTGDANASVLFTEGTTVLGSATADGTGAWTFTPALVDGPHTIVATETDTAGSTGTATLTFTLDTTTPVLTVTLTSDTGSSNSDNITNNPALSGTAEANAVVTLMEEGSTIGSTTADGTGAWTYTPTLPDGSHLIDVSETNAAGSTSTTSITFDLDTTAPLVTETLITDTGSSASDNITNDPALSGTGDPNAMVTLTEGTTVIGSTTANGTGAWTFTPTLSDGAHTIVASETNTPGNTGSSTLTFTLDTTAPAAPVITSPSLTDVAAPVITGIAEAGSTVTLTVDGATYITLATANGWSVNLATATPVSGSLSLDDNGANSVSATATDPGGNISTPATQTLTIDTTAPGAPTTLALAAGSDSGVLGDGITNVTTPTVQGTGETGDTLTLYDGEVAIGTTTVVNGNWSVTPSMALSAGSHNLTARQTDPAGNVSVASPVLPLVIDTTLPAAPSGVALAAGSDSGVTGDGITSATSPVITGNGTAGDTVKIYEGTTLLGSTTVAEGGVWSLTVGPLTDSTYTLTTTQTDLSDSVSAASAPFALTIDTTSPHVTAVLAANPHNTAGTVYNQVLDGGGDPNASVTIRDGTVVVGTATADATGAWSFDLAGLAAGSHSLIASETDAAGNTGASAAVPVTVAPSVVPDTRFTLATGNPVTSGAFFGSDYTGAAGHLQAQYGYVGTANVSVIANVANVFIYGGTGDDAVVAKAGSNVLDGAGGSNWMIGASGADGGTDTFFVDNRTSQNTWNTLLNFHVGDMMTVWDFNPAAGSINFADNLGQPGYTGLTLEAGLGNGTGATDLATFAGLSSSTAHLVTSTGTSGGLSYLAVTRVA